MRQLRILLVEDDAIISTLLAEMLTGMGHFVCAITSSEAEAVAAAAYHRPDFMIVDIQLRGGSGTSAMKTILRRQVIPHLFVSGAVIPAGKPNAVVLRKPFRESALVAAMERALSLAGGDIATL